MRRGSTEPRIFTPPLRELTPETSAGYSVIAFSNEVMEIALHPWQEWLYIHALELTADGRFRFRTLIILIARQNGKSLWSQILALWFMYILGARTVLGTAQSLDVSEEVWQGAVNLAQDTPELADEIKRVVRVNGKKALELEAGQRYKVQAATRKGGRGYSGDLILLDELREHQSWDAWGAITKTTLARDDALIIGLSNAGDATSVVLRHLRLVAHRALGDPDGICAALDALDDDDQDMPDDESLGIFEWSADPDCDIKDRDEWAKANPSLGYTITERALAAALVTDDQSVFKTECLCQWVMEAAAPPFPVGAWEAGKDKASEIAPDSQLFYGVDVAADRLHASVAVCGMRADGNWHTELIAYSHGIGWLEGWFAKRSMVAPMTVALQGRGAPVSSVADIIAAIDGVEVVECVGRDVAAYAGRLWDAVAACEPDEESDSDSLKAMHRPQPALDLAANIAATKPLGDGAWGWDRNKSQEDISPLVACNMAFGLATAVDKEESVPSAYENPDHELLFV
jgi:hypothetical protein